MGKRSATETVIAILMAFIERSSWTQAALARRVDLATPQVRKHLLELMRQGVPLEPEHEHPHVVWSVPLGWFPAGVTLRSTDAQELLRHLARAPKTDERDRLLVALATAGRSEAPAGIEAVAHTSRDETHLRVIEDACATKCAVTLRYGSTRRAYVDERTVSVQRILLGPRPRFLAHCHKTNELRFFRVSRIEAAALAPTVHYVPVAADIADAFIATSISGYRDPSGPIFVAFTVRDPEARWVRDTTPMAMENEARPNGVRFTAETAAITALARFVVGLGEAATVETPELLSAVRDLAKGSLTSNGPNIRSVTSIRSTDSSTGAG